MENGLYGHGYRGHKKLEYALGFYKKSSHIEGGCREALYKIGEFHKNGYSQEKNLAAAIRRFDESQAEGHVLAMNALGSLYYNELKDYVQAVEWFKKASNKGCTRSINNLGKCYENGHGVLKDRDRAFKLY